jgi:hypothetical protein
MNLHPVLVKCGHGAPTRPNGKACQDRSNGGNFSKVTSSRLLQAGAMAEETNKSKRYLRWAAANEQRAASVYNEELKTLFLGIAAQYRDLAEQLDDPEQWRANAGAARTKRT